MKLTASRKYPGIPTVGPDLESHTRVLEAVRDAIQIHERRTADVLSSFVRVKDLIDLGFVRLEGSNLLVPVELASGGAVDAENVTYDNATSGLTAENMQDAIDELAGAPAVSLEDEIKADSPTAFWKMDEASGTFLDSSGNGFHLTSITGTINYRRSVLIPSLPNTKFAQIPSGSNRASLTSTLGTTPPLTGNWTVEACVCPRFHGANLSRVFTIGGNAETEAQNDQVILIVDGSGGLLRVAWEQGAGSTVSVSSNVNLSEGCPYHIAAEKNGASNTVSFFVNGIPVAEISYENEPTGGTGGLVVTIGESPDGADTGDFVVGYVAFYNGVNLSGDRIFAHARAGGFF